MTDRPSDSEIAPTVELEYAPTRPARLSPMEVVGHTIFAIGTGLVAGSIIASINYNWAGAFYQWRPHIATVGGTMMALIVSFRLGRIFRM